MTQLNRTLSLVSVNPYYDNSVPVGSNIRFTFSEPIVAGSGFIIITNSLGEVVLRESVNGPNVKIQDNVLILDPSVDLAFATDYRVTISSGIVKATDGLVYTVGYPEVASFRTEISNVPVNFNGSDRTETIYGGTQADQLNGGGGADTIFAYDGDDVINGDDISDTNIYANDMINAGNGNDLVHGNVGNDWLGGDFGNDTLYGDAGDDSINGGRGNDVLYGGTGDDSLFDDGGQNQLYGGEGNDKFYSYSSYEAGDFSQLFGGPGKDEFAANGADDVYGDEGDDLINFQPNFSHTRSATLDGGSGDDQFALGLDSHQNTINIVTGPGRDTLALRYSYSAFQGTHYLVHDFSPGQGGDKIDLSNILASYNNVIGNPFASGGILKLVQQGSDTVLQLKPQNSTASDFINLLVLKNILPSQMTSANFVGDINPDGSQTGATIVGTVGPDTLRGNVLNDHISGLSGNDQLFGGVGNDTLVGGASDSFQDADTLDGGDGDDLLIGGSDNDLLYGQRGNDTLEGGEGNDQFLDTFGFNVFRGQGGDDEFQISATDYEPFEGGEYEGGSGNDLFTINAYSRVKNVTLSGGEGADTYLIQKANMRDVKVLDFSVADGDKIDLSFLIPNAGTGASLANPFGSSLGYFRLDQVGSQVVLMFDEDGAKGSEYGMRPILTLENLQVQSLSAANFTNGWHPNGRDVGVELRGTRDADRLVGMGLNDTIYGGESNDTIQAGAGDDWLFGDAGDDVLYGESGNDFLVALAGSDTLFGGEGNDVLEGGDGDDVLNDESGTNILRGGAGKDQISINANGSSVEGGEGDDVIRTAVGALTVDAGPGNDRVEFGSFWAPQTGNEIAKIDLGDGDDKLFFSPQAQDSIAIVTGGSGKDTYELSSNAAYGHLIVSDFQAGRDGDVIDLMNLISTYNYKSGNPLGSGGVFRIVQKAADTVIEFDNDGPEHLLFSFRPILTLKNVQASALKTANFIGSLNPDGSNMGLTISGNEKSEILKGTLLDDRIFGLNGNDTIYGESGNDQLDGWEGNDSLDGGEGGDTLRGGAGDDSLSDRSRDGDNYLSGDAGNDWIISDGMGQNLLLGGEGNDTLTAGNGNDALYGQDGNDRISVQVGAYSNGQPVKSHIVTVSGGNGQDSISLQYGYSGVEKVTAQISGGAGIDQFILNGVYSNVQFIINDFVAGKSGDILNLTNLLPYSVRDKNPFGTSGYARLIQRGEDTIVQIDTDGPDGDKQFQDTYTLTKINAADITAANFVNYFSPDGIDRGVEREGDESDDQIDGTRFNDTLFGASGDDKIDGGLGNDQLFGGAGNDQLEDGAGDNTIAGGAGNDKIRISGGGYNQVDAGAGDDIVTFIGGTGVILGGDGNDQISVSNQTYGGAPGKLTLDGGAGNDQFIFSDYPMNQLAIEVRGGNGAELYQLGMGSLSSELTILDFDTATNGDQISLTSITNYLNYMYSITGNPFTNGYLELQQRGKDTVLIFDADGKGAALGKVIMTLQNVDVNQLNKNHFLDFYDPKGGTEGMTFNGDAQANTLRGGWSSDKLFGLAGNDSLNGSGGNDFIDGGDGDDMLLAGFGNDTLIGGNGFDAVTFNEAFNNYKITRSESGFAVQGRYYDSQEGVDSISGVEYLQFSNLKINLSVKEKASSLPENNVKMLVDLYLAFFNRIPDADGIAYWLDQLKAGKSMATISESFYAIATSDQFASTSGFSKSMSDDNFIHAFYRNVLGRAQGADEGGLNYWKGKLADGSTTRSSLAQEILTAAHGFKGNADFGHVADLLDNKFVVGKTVAIDWGINFVYGAYEQTVSIAAAVTSNSTQQALQLVGVNAEDFQFF